VTDTGGASTPLTDQQRRKVLGLVGLGARGRLVVVGVEQVRLAAQKGNLQLVLVAQDVSQHSLDKVVPVLRARRVEMVEWPSAAELGGAVGREITAAIGIVDQALARGIRGAVAGAAPAGDATRVSR
jgi:ribosomal protein L7Ae-like RNA K-turn-binding protein